MKVLHVITTINLGGAENHLVDLIEAQVKAGLQVGVAYLKGDGYWSKLLKKKGVGVFPLNVTNMSLIYKFSKLSKIIKDFNPDLVHAHMPPAELMTRLAIQPYPSMPLIISKHNDEPFAPGFKNFLLGSWVASRAKKVICISSAVYRYMQTNLSLSCSKLKLVYYAVDVEKFASAVPAQDISRPEGHLVFGTVARLTAQKSLNTLIEAFALFNKKQKSILHIVGTGELENELKELCAKLGVVDKIVWHGKRNDIPSVIKRFDVFILPSIYEGFGLVLLEAMAAEVPIIASNVSAIPEVLDFGNSGLLFEKKNVLALLDCMNAMTSMEARKIIIEAGKNRVRTQFSIKKMQSETRAIYDQVILK